ncbi:transcriptional regulator, SarA/Rot family [Microvirga ossetica]|uniref:transcriptional regulator, SarA/Rot family n=1 Tax=Microvirga ossetica TaxID=1882682 RepID=UPI001F01F641|nr:MarR family transcriptional regulator [Microvirga ossetica]
MPITIVDKSAQSWPSCLSTTAIDKPPDWRRIATRDDSSGHRLEPSTITPAVKRLESAGFVARQRSASDERQVQVHLSKKGRDLHAMTGCLTEALLRHSGFTVPEMIELNQKVHLLRDGMTKALADT